MPFFLGNDVVALTSPRCRGRENDARFLNRVFSAEERAVIAASSAPQTAVWLHWAAKESIFKSVTKALGRAPIFHHSSFHISFSHDLRVAIHAPGAPAPSTAEPTLTLVGKGRFEAFDLQLQVELKEDFIHAVAWIPHQAERPRVAPRFLAEVHVRTEDEIPVRKEALRQSFSGAEWGCVSHTGSALTRLRAREALASSLSVPEDRLEIRCGPGAPGRRVPLVYLDGKEISTDLTLSHDANLMAWAFILPDK